MVAISHFKMAAMQNLFCSIAPQRDKIDIVSGCTYIFGVEEKDASMHKLFCDGHFEIQDGRHVGSNLVTSGS